MTNDGATGYFNTGINPDTLSMTPSNTTLSMGIHTALTSPNFSVMGSFFGASSQFYGITSSNTGSFTRFHSMSNVGQFIEAGASGNVGIITAVSGTDGKYAYRGNTEIWSGGSSSGVPPAFDMYLMARNNSGTAGTFQQSVSRNNFFAIGRGLTEAQAINYQASTTTLLGAI